MSTINLATLLVLLKLNSQQYEDGTEKAKKKTVDLEKMIGGALVGALTVAAAAAVQFGKESVAEFQTFEKGIKEVYTLLPGISQSAMDEMKGDVIDFGKEVGRTSDEVVPALYQALSAGISQDSVFEFLEVASKSAQGGVTDLETAVDGITSVVNAYGDTVIDAATASDVMFTAVKLGKTDFEQLSSSLFNVIPTAASLGVGFDDVAASLAALTAQGTPTSVATTQLRQAFIEASKSGTLLDKAIKDLSGQSFTQLIASGMSSTDIFNMLRDSMPEQEFKDLFGSVEAMNAVMGLTNDTAAGIIDSFGTVEDTVGATDAAAATMAESMEHLEARSAAATEAFKIQVGEGLSPLKEAYLENKIAAMGFIGAQVEIAGAFWEGNLTYAESLKLQSQLTFTSMDAAEAMVELENMTTGSTEATRAYNEAAGEYYAAQAAAIEATKEAALASEADALAIREAAQARAEAAGVNEEFSDKVLQTASHLTEEEAAVAAANAANAKYFDGLESGTPVVDDFSEATAAAEAALAGYFTAALNAEGGAGFFNESLDQLGEQFVSVGGRTAEQNEDLASLQEAYDKAAGTVRDYELGIKGANLTDEERATKIAEQQELMVGLASSMEPLLGITGELTAKNVEATINQDAVNQAIFDAAAAAGGSAVELAVLGGALGLYSEEATEAALKSALIQEKIDQLAAAYVAGDTSVAQMREELASFIADVGGVADGMLGAAENADGLTGSVGLLGTEIGNVSAAAIDAATNLAAIPGEIPVHISITSDPIPTLPNMPGGGNQPQAFASGGYTSGAENQIAGLVHGQEFVFSAPAVRSIGLPILEMLHAQAQHLSGGGNTSFGDIYVTPGRDDPIEYGRATRDSLLKTARSKGLRM